MLSGQCQLAPLRERGCHDGVKAFVYVCIYMRAVVLRGPAALPVLPDPTDPVEPIQPQGIDRGPSITARLFRRRIVRELQNPRVAVYRILRELGTPNAGVGDESLLLNRRQWRER